MLRDHVLIMGDLGRWRVHKLDGLVRSCGRRQPLRQSFHAENDDSTRQQWRLP